MQSKSLSRGLAKMFIDDDLRPTQAAKQGGLSHFRSLHLFEKISK